MAYTSDLTSGKTYFGPVFAGRSLSEAFDDNIATMWYGTGSGGNPLADSIGVDFGSPKDIRQLTLYPTGYGCNTFKLQYSDDGTTFYDAYSGTAGQGGGTRFTYNSFASVGAHRYWRVLVMSTFSSGSSGFYDIEMMELAATTKHLIQDGENIVKSTDGTTIVIIGTAPVTEAMFVANGMSDLSNINSVTIGLLANSSFKILSYVPN